MKGYLVFILFIIGLPVFGNLGIGGVILGIAFALLMMNGINQRSTTNKNSQDDNAQVPENDNLKKICRPSLVDSRLKPQRSFFSSPQPSSQVPHTAFSSECNTKPCSDIDVAIAVLNGARIEKIARKAITVKMAKREHAFHYPQQKEVLRNEQDEWLSDDDINCDDYLNEPTHPLHPWAHQIEPFYELYFGNLYFVWSIPLTEDDYFTRSDNGMSLEYVYDGYGHSCIDAMDDRFLECDESCFDNDVLIEGIADVVDAGFIENIDWLDDAVETTISDDFEFINE